MAELLCPAGGKASLNAAVRAGADAVYLGLEAFNARINADNFSVSDMSEVVEYCHLRDVKVYVTVNTLLITREVEEAKRLVEACVSAGVDAFIVQDAGFSRWISCNYGAEKVHISTQMNICNTQGVELARALGAGRITLARELSLSEIEEICALAHSYNIEVETFIHGAICVCYSGQCLMSSLIGARSANRGTCSQCCRLPYELISGEKKPLASKNGGESHLLSTKDMCCIEHLHELAYAGVDSFKIEGRMKSAEYVYGTVSVYRRILDEVERTNTQPEVSEEDMKDLASSFSRGFTDGYLKGESGESLMSTSRPNNRGVFAGRIKSIDSQHIKIKTEFELVPGDVISIWNKSGTTTIELDKDCNFISESLIILKNRREFKGLRATDRVFRVRSASSDFSQDFREPRLPLNADISIHIGQPIVFKVSSGETSYKLEGDIAEAARTKSLTVDDVISHFDRLGNSDFVLQNCNVDLEDGVGMGFSTIHKLRSEAVDALRGKIIRANEDGLTKTKKPKNTSEPAVRPLAKKIKSSDCEICVIATNPEAARAAKRAGASVYVPLLNFVRGGAAYSGQSGAAISQTTYPDDVTLMMPLVSRKSSKRGLLGAEALDITRYMKEGRRVYCDDLSTYLVAKEHGLQAEIGQMVPLTNDLDVVLAGDMDAGAVWLSPELNMSQVSDVARKMTCDVGLFVFGRQRLMQTEHCALSSQKGCSEQCDKCRIRQKSHYLHDRMGVDFPVQTDILGRTTVYNSLDLDLMPSAKDLREAGVKNFMIDATFLDIEKMLSIVDRCVKSLENPPKKRLSNTTSGHLFRGV